MSLHLSVQISNSSLFGFEHFHSIQRCNGFLIFWYYFVAILNVTIAICHCYCLAFIYSATIFLPRFCVCVNSLRLQAFCPSVLPMHRVDRRQSTMTLWEELSSCNITFSLFSCIWINIPLIVPLIKNKNLPQWVCTTTIQLCFSQILVTIELM